MGDKKVTEIWDYIVVGAGSSGCVMAERLSADNRAVVDPQLRVNGVRGLRVVDCSVIPAHIPKDLTARVDAMAAFEDRPCGWAVKQALADWADMAEERHRMTLAG